MNPTQRLCSLNNVGVAATAGCLAMICATIAATFCATSLFAEPPQAEPSQDLPSSYAPAADLSAQLEELREHLQTDLADPSEYGEYQQQRIVMDANTLAALVLVLGKHDQANTIKDRGNAAQIITAARELARAAKSHEAAKQAMAIFEAQLAKRGDGQALEWKTSADIAQLMKQVPIANNNLRRGVEGRRFDRLADKNAGYAALLAAMAQASSVDTSYCADEADEQTWRKYCDELRDAASLVRKSVREGDQKQAVEALGAVARSCDSCHEAFGVK
ncbi:MAG: hypothetical protein RIC55_02030 [Pirellulaceae bacterium]